jgi:hypothetical protein
LEKREKMSKPKQVLFKQVLLKWDAAHSLLVLDLKNPTAGYFQIFMFPPNLHRNEGALCSGLCGHHLKRFHFSCLRCRLRRVFFGKIKNPVPVTPYVILLRKSHLGGMGKIIKTWLMLLEFLDNL